MTTRAFKGAILVCFLALLASCAGTRPPGLTCSLDKYLLPNDPITPFAAAPDELNVLVLSAGGEFGAYGAGFLRGWNEVKNAAPISPKALTVVTGVSTGALVSTHAFLGRFDEIDEAYRSISGSEVYEQRSALSLLFSDSLTDASGKDRIIARYLTHEIIEAVRTESHAHPERLLLAGTVDLDSSEFLRIDLTYLARDETNPNRDDCFRAVVSAASAIPLAFQPKFIDNRMLVDGGLRHYTFIQTIPSAYQGPDVKRRVFAIYHGDLTAGREVVPDSLLGVAKRAFTVIADQAIKDSAYRLDYIARFAPPERRFDTYYADASGAARACEPRRADPSCHRDSHEDSFCRPFMECLSSAGRDAGRTVAASNTWTRELMTKSLGSSP